MTDELLPYYEQELAHIRKSGAEFAERNPKIAARLRMSEEVIEDPHVSRLIESVAYLNARIQHKLDNDFPELTEGLLGVLYPHYQQPLPSSCIVQYQPAKDLDGPYPIDKGTVLETDSFQGENCRFTTNYPVDLLPLKIAEVSLNSRPFIAPESSNIQSPAMLKIKLDCLSEDQTLDMLDTDKIRFYISAQSQTAYKLQQLLLRDCCNIVVSSSDEKASTILNSSHIKPVGFSTNEGIYPYPDTAFMGYRLLSEFFTCPEKFLFFEIDGLSSFLQHSASNNIELYLYLNQADQDLEKQVDKQSLSLGCTPAINLFEQQVDPVNVSHEKSEYQLTADIRRPHNMEIYQVLTVNALDSKGKRTPYRPFYGLDHSQILQQENCFWHAKRIPLSAKPGRSQRGSDIRLSLVDLSFDILKKRDEILEIKSLCFNADLPSKLPFGGGQPFLRVLNGAPPVEQIQCLSAPSHVVKPGKQKQSQWKLLSHLNLNKLSLANHSSIKELLSLYDFSNTASTKNLIASIVDLQSKAIAAPIKVDGRSMLARGTQITVTFDESLLSGSSAFLFASVLERFFALYCSINSFTRLVAKIKGKEGVMHQWPPRAGEQQLV